VDRAKPQQLELNLSIKPWPMMQQMRPQQLSKQLKKHN
jgi:hypothetical protein